MRCFVAIEIPEEVKSYLYELQRMLSHGSFAKVTWVHKKNLHVTLKFLGEVPEHKVDAVKSALSSVKFSSFSLRLKGIGFFPNEKKPRVIWVGLEPDFQLIALQQKIDEALLSLFPAEQHFEAHLTIGRIKFVKKKEEFLALLKKICIKLLEFKVSSFKLMKSELTREGPIYSLLEEFKATD